jgi:hypothetical protein
MYSIQLWLPDLVVRPTNMTSVACESIGWCIQRHIPLRSLRVHWKDFKLVVSDGRTISGFLWTLWGV